MEPDTKSIVDYEPRNYKEFKELVRIDKEGLKRNNRLYELILRFKRDILMEAALVSKKRVLYNIGLDSNPTGSLISLLGVLIKQEEEQEGGVNNEQQA